MYTYGQYIQVDNINETIYETIYKNQQLHVNRYRPINAACSVGMRSLSLVDIWIRLLKFWLTSCKLLLKIELIISTLIHSFRSPCRINEKSSGIVSHFGVKSI